MDLVYGFLSGSLLVGGAYLLFNRALQIGITRLIISLTSLGWTTLEELVQDGNPVRYCQSILPKLYKAKLLEVRIRSDLDLQQADRAHNQGFVSATVSLHEFRLKIPVARGKTKERALQPHIPVAT